MDHEKKAVSYALEPPANASLPPPDGCHFGLLGGKFSFKIKPLAI